MERGSRHCCLEWRVSQHALSVNGKRDNITRDDLLFIGKSIKNKKSESIIKEINEIVDNWKIFANEVGVSKILRDEIDKTLVRILWNKQF